MRAADLLEQAPVFPPDDDAILVLKQVTARRLPGLGVELNQPPPLLVVSTLDVLRALVPRYVQDDPCLALVYDEDHADRIANGIIGRRIGEVLPREPAIAACVDPDATLIELASVMIQLRCPLVSVQDGEHLLGVVTANRLLESLLPTLFPGQTRAS